MDGRNQNGQPEIDFGANEEVGSGAGEEESVIIHNGKRYNRIQIEGLGDDDEYLMDSKGDIYSLDFKFLINMGDNVEILEQ